MACWAYFRGAVDILLQMLRRPPGLCIQRLNRGAVLRYVRRMKNWWPHFLLPVLLASTFAPVMADTIDNDDVSQRVHRRAELRSALSTLVPTEQAEDKTSPFLAHERQLSAQERANLRRQLREQFRALGFDTHQDAAPVSATAPVNHERPE